MTTALLSCCIPRVLPFDSLSLNLANHRALYLKLTIYSRHSVYFLPPLVFVYPRPARVTPTLLFTPVPFALVPMTFGAWSLVCAPDLVLDTGTSLLAAARRPDTRLVVGSTSLRMRLFGRLVAAAATRVTAGIEEGGGEHSGGGAIETSARAVVEMMMVATAGKVPASVSAEVSAVPGAKDIAVLNATTATVGGSEAGAVPVGVEVTATGDPGAGTEPGTATVREPAVISAVEKVAEFNPASCGPLATVNVFMC